MKIHETLEDITEGQILFQVPRHLIWKKTPKKMKKHAFRHWTAHSAPSMIHAPRAFIFCTLMCPKHSLCPPSMKKNGPELIFATLKWKKAQFLSPTLGGNFPYKYQIFHSERNGSRERQVLGASRDEFLSSLQVSMVFLFFF